jgi:transposase
MLAVLADQLRDVAARVVAMEGELMAWHRANEVSQRLATIPEVGLIIRARLWRRLGTRPSSSLAGSSPLGWGWCRNSGPAAARSAWARSRSAGTGTFVG